MFADQVKALKERYRCITFDFRGQGQSEVTRGGYDMETLAADATALIEALGCGPCHFVGLSMGGFIAMRLAIRRPDLIKSLLLLETTATQTESTGNYRRLNFIARWFGLRPVAKTGHADHVWAEVFDGSDRVWPCASNGDSSCSPIVSIGITHAVEGVITRQGLYEQLDQISVPTLILVGDQDVATVRAKAARIHARIAASTLHIIPGAGHTATVEETRGGECAADQFFRESGLTYVTNRWDGRTVDPSLSYCLTVLPSHRLTGSLLPWCTSRYAAPAVRVLHPMATTGRRPLPIILQIVTFQIGVHFFPAQLAVRFERFLFDQLADRLVTGVNREADLIGVMGAQRLVDGKAGEGQDITGVIVPFNHTPLCPGQSCTAMPPAPEAG